MTYTKGEWTVEHEFNVFSDNRLVAACGGYADNWKTEEVHNENVSNARLIAAAPDMLEALKEIRNADLEMSQSLEATIEIVLRKAEGK